MVKNAEAFPFENQDSSVPSAEQNPSALADVDVSGNGAANASDRGLQTMFEFDPNDGTLKWSDDEAASRIFGVARDQIASTGTAFSECILDDEDEARVAAFVGQRPSYACEYQLRRPDGKGHWVEERGGWIGTGPNRRLISVIRSIEGRKRREEQLSWLALNDELTGLLNRAHLRKTLETHIARLESGEQTGAYILAGIDDVGAINADFGFEAADKVIVETSQRLSGVLGPKDRIGRVAGTKFGIIINDCDAEELRQVCVRLLNVVRENVVNTKSGAVAASVSLGAVSLPEQATTTNETMTRAEAALDAAKRIGKSSWSLFTDKTDVVSMRRRNTHMSDVILTALNERRVRLAFQPIVGDLDEVPAKFECLIRMHGEDGQLVPAPEFIPAAERLGLVHLLDRRVLELALNTLAVCPNIHLNVNISMETVKDFVWAEGYIALLRAHQEFTNRITVELTETQIIDSIDATIEFVSEIKRLGCSFGIDDFGAGYTSFRNLKAMDIDILKIDGSFVTGVSSSRENQLFVRTLLDLARNFGMKTVAEWVDNEADAMLLKGLGVDYLQGFMIGKPEITPDWLPEGAPNDAPQRSVERG
ncbi:putative bifunctional diguanylate cyclase/phosphodiesterase [Hyphococcus sp. DH-69]|uniref:putative bifunctional diguanylate cyclase/phosphodiesterase n=1 Tax=Hyphococcus formosus TaxID=3143534 RepID=UPI00398B5490